MLDLRLNSADNKGRSDWRGKQREIKRNEKKIKKKDERGVENRHGETAIYRFSNDKEPTERTKKDTQRNIETNLPYACACVYTSS